MVLSYHAYCKHQGLKGNKVHTNASISKMSYKSKQVHIRIKLGSKIIVGVLKFVLLKENIQDRFLYSVTNM
jgi:hypothetical protein